MADVGTKAVTLAVLEQDLYAAKWNIDIVCREADGVGMEIHAVPSRWGGLVAGAPKVPSMFTARNPQTWILMEDGSPLYSKASGPASSVHHPEVKQFFRESLRTMLTVWPIKGIVWDEVKTLDVKDYSPESVKALGNEPSMEQYTDAVGDFFDEMGAFCKQVQPNVMVSLFLYAHTGGYSMNRCARIEHLDYFGCDGRPWGMEEGYRLEGDGSRHRPDKVLLGGHGELFIGEAKKFGKGGLLLLENHNMTSECFDAMDACLPEVLGLGAEQVIYYYYPRNVDDPDRQMSIIAKHLKTVKAYQPSS